MSWQQTAKDRLGFANIWPEGWKVVISGGESSQKHGRCPILGCRKDAATWKKDCHMDTNNRSVLVYLGRVSKETKAPAMFGSPELGNPIYAYRV